MTMPGSERSYLSFLLLCLGMLVAVVAIFGFMVFGVYSHWPPPLIVGASTLAFFAAAAYAFFRWALLEDRWQRQGPAKYVPTAFWLAIAALLCWQIVATLRSSIEGQGSALDNLLASDGAGRVLVLLGLLGLAIVAALPEARRIMGPDPFAVTEEQGNDEPAAFEELTQRAPAITPEQRRAWQRLRLRGAGRIGLIVGEIVLCCALWPIIGLFPAVLASVTAVVGLFLFLNRRYGL